jgi:predicted ATPase/DNA-binding CsgD family transcriptional regulator
MGTPGDGAGMQEGAEQGRFALPALPVPATSFVGREADLSRVIALVTDSRVRLLTLTGPGGIGKTRLALEVARRRRAATPVAFIPLDTTFRPAMIANTIVQRLGIELVRDELPVDALRRVIGTGEFLLVLDNLEHLLPGVSLLTDLLDASPRLVILATSRVRLGLPNEQVVSLGPLPLPAAGNGHASDAASAEAVRLFTERARSVQPAFTLGRHNLASVVTIVQRMEGLPLAIELAAARTALLSPHLLAERLERRLPLLDGAPGNVPSRQQTMRAAVAWSVDLLPDDLRALWELLGIFSGGFTIDAAEAIAEACGPFGLAVMDGVQALADQSLLVPRTNANGEPRFAMLETTREYALECLSERGAAEAARTAHATFFQSFARAVEPGLKGNDGWTWFHRVDADLPNIRLALEWFRSHGNIEAALEIAGCLEWFWTVPAYLSEGRALLDSLLQLGGPDIPARIRGKAWMALGDLVEWHGDAEHAAEVHRHALEAAREAGDQALVAAILRSLGSVTMDLYRFDEAEALFSEAYSLAMEAGDLWTMAASANLTGLVSRLQGDLEQAHTWHESALSIWQQSGNRDHTPIALVGLARVFIDRHEDQRALETLDAALALTADDEDDFDTSTALDGLATLAARHGQYDLAARLLAVSSRLRQVSNMPLRPPTRREFEHVLTEVRAMLGSAAFAVAWAEGQALSAADAKRLARTVTVRDPSPQDGLSAREREVLSLLVEGASDSEIADRLYITRRTASKHVASILEKLGAGNRTAAATIAHRRGLV